MRRRLPALVLAGALVCLRAATAQAAPPVASPTSRPLLQITADTLQVDAQTQVVVAVGRVRVTDGTTTATAARATLYRREGRGVLIGQARVRGPHGVLEGDEIAIEYTRRAITRLVARGGASLEAEGSLVSARMVTIVPAADSVTAEREVTLLIRPDIIATGARLVYLRARGVATLEGRGRMQNPDGFIEADRIEVSRRAEQATATGSVHGVFRDTEIQSHTAVVFAAEKKAIFAGDVRLIQPDRRMITERVTFWYAVRRVVAEGQTTIRLEPPP